MKTATVGGTSIAYKYDPFGQRLSKTVNGTLTRYLAPGGEVLAEYNSAGTMTARYVPGVFLDRPVLMERPANGTKYFYQHDRLGSVGFLTSNTGAVVESYAYGPFGETSSASSVGNPYRYAGREYEPETGLYYNRARYLSPALGRFLQPDPIGYFDSLNLYGYVGNDPFNYLDPSGFVTDGSSTAETSWWNRQTTVQFCGVGCAKAWSGELDSRSLPEPIRQL